jgi:HAD superfamily hydrolase (TIGR01509 family)
MNNSAFDLVIFDCDGVLVESEELACQLYVQMFAEYGYQLNYIETLHKFYGTTLPERITTTAQEIGWNPPDNFATMFYQRQAALTEQELQAVPHVHELVESISLPVCVASNGSREEINLRLRVTKLLPYFVGVIFSGMEFANPKPAPDVYLAAAQAFNIHPSRCVVVEDSVLGVTAAVAAGMKVYGHATFNSADKLQAAGAIPFGSMLELKEILARECSAV